MSEHTAQNIGHDDEVVEVIASEVQPLATATVEGTVVPDDGTIHFATEGLDVDPLMSLIYGFITAQTAVNPNCSDDDEDASVICRAYLDESIHNVHESIAKLGAVATKDALVAMGHQLYVDRHPALDDGLIRINGNVEEAGCYIDGHWGQYGICRLVDIAQAYGLVVSEEDKFSLDSSNWEDDDDDYLDGAIFAADSVEQLLNDATTGGYWEWVDGEFFLSANDVEPTDDEVNEFIRGYDECVEFTDPDGDYDDEMVEEGHDDCRAFITSELDDLRAAVEHYSVRAYGRGEGTAWDWMGHDFWLTRNGHGAGFWDRGLGELGDRLTDAAHAYGSVDVPTDEEDEASIPFGNDALNLG